jgi:ribosomal protein L40E
MSVLDNLSKRVSETAKAAAKKSGEIVEVTKLNMSISAEEDKIAKSYAIIGKVVYDAFAAGKDIPLEFHEVCLKVLESFKSIEEMKTKVLELKDLKTCPKCNTELEIDVAFCPKCGTKQE